MPINLPALDLMTRPQRYEYLVWEMMNQGSSEGLAYFAMHEFRTKPTKAKYICVLEEFIDQNAPGMAINLGDQKQHVDTQVVDDLNQLLVVTKTRRGLADAMRAEGLAGRLRASLSTGLRPPPPPTAFDPILAWQVANLPQIVGRYVRGASPGGSGSLKQLFGRVVKRLKDDGFTWCDGLAVPR